MFQTKLNQWGLCQSVSRTRAPATSTSTTNSLCSRVWSGLPDEPPCEVPFYPQPNYYRDSPRMQCRSAFHGAWCNVLSQRKQNSLCEHEAITKTVVTPMLSVSPVTHPLQNSCCLCFFSLSGSICSLPVTLLTCVKYIKDQHKARSLQSYEAISDPACYKSPSFS